jgi:fumarate hydratase subunit alpha
MREISAAKITETVAKLCRQANYFLPEDVWRAVEEAYQKEKAETPREILGQILQNARLAGQKELALCQDTGIADVFIKLGQQAIVGGISLKDAVNKGVAEGYTKGYLRKSIVSEPLGERKNTEDNTPANIYIESVPGDNIEITVLPKGGGTENASALIMLSPSQGWQGVKDFIIDTVKKKGVNACPPLVVGVGIGGSFSTVALLAKKALLRPVGSSSGDVFYRSREEELLKEINATGIGPMGLGGAATALGVNIEFAPCHIASLPVAVSMQCHSMRRKTEKI